MGTNETGLTPEQEADLVENLRRFNHLRLGGDLRSLADWQHECLRQDRLRGDAVTALARIRKILDVHTANGDTDALVRRIQGVLGDMA